MNLKPRERLLRVLSWIRQRRRATTAQVAQAMGLSKDVAREDLCLLHEAGWIRPVGEGRDRDWMVDPLAAHERPDLYDALALRIGQEHCSFLKATPLQASLERLDRSSQEALGVSRQRLAAKLVCLQEPARRYEDQEDVIDELLEGLLGERRLRVGYRERAPEDYEPLTLVIYRRSLFLLARRVGETKIQRLAVHRIRSIQRGDSFVWPEDWDPQAALAPWFGIFAQGPLDEVVLHFDADKADLVLCRDWHPTQAFRRLPDGRVALHLRTGGPELVRFVLEWGPTVEVVAPAWLRTQVIDQLQRALLRYAPAGQGPGAGPLDTPPPLEA